jgi:hypothetical protein
MQVIQPITDKKLISAFKPPKAFLKAKPLIITWEKLPPDFELPDDPVDNLAQPLLADALREALGLAGFVSPSQLMATNFGIVATVNGEFAIKAPDWVYISEVIPLKHKKDRKSYTPYEEGGLPEIVMEFLSDNEGREYNKKSTPPYGKWYFYEQILKVPFYVIFNPENGVLEVYQLKSKRYQLQKPDKTGRYWIETLGLFLGTWEGTKEDTNRTGFWLRWWNKENQLLLWGFEKLEQAEVEKRAALEKAEKAAQQAETTTALRIAKQMLEANAEIAFIMQVTGLDKASIEHLQD